MSKKVFFSFYYDEDVFRMHQIRNIGAITNTPILDANDFESIRQAGDSAVRSWINSQMKNIDCLAVLIGENTHTRKWVKYEIENAIKMDLPIFGLHIHRLQCPKNDYSKHGIDPLENVHVDNGVSVKPISNSVYTYRPNYYDAYNDIVENIEGWVQVAIDTLGDRRE